MDPHTQQMQTRLDQKIEGLRSNAMTFNTDGIEFSLSIPDSRDVKDAFGVVAVTIVEQEREIGKLQATIVEMAQENENRQKEIIAWTSNCLDELRAQNTALVAKLSDAESQLKNFSYNIQGYIEGDHHGEVKMQAVNVVKTFEVGLSDGQAKKVVSLADPIVFQTEDSQVKGVFSGNSERKLDAGKDGTNVTNLEVKSRSKSVEEIKKRKLFYDSIPANKCPVAARSRWRWATRRVMAMNRIKAMRIGITRTRVAKGASIADRIERIESELFRIPREIQNLIENRAASLNERIREESETLTRKIEDQEASLALLSSSLENQIAEVNHRCSMLDEKALNLASRIEEQEKRFSSSLTQLSDRVDRRANDAMTAQINSFRKRAIDIKDLIRGLKSGLDGLLNNLSVAAAAHTAAINGENRGQQLADVLKMDVELRKSRQTIGSIETNVFTISGLIKGLRRDVGQFEAPGASAAADSLATFKDEVIASCGELDEAVQGISTGLTDTEEFWKTHDGLLSTRWDVLADFANMCETAESASSGLTQIVEELKAKPSVEDVNNIAKEKASESIAAALEPVQGKIQGVNDRMKQLDSSVETTRNELAVTQQTVAETVEATSRKLSMASFPFDAVEERLEPAIKTIVDSSLQTFAATVQTFASLPSGRGLGVIDDDDDDGSALNSDDIPRADSGGKDNLDSLQPSLRPASAGQEGRDPDGDPAGDIENSDNGGNALQSFDSYTEPAVESRRSLGSYSRPGSAAVARHSKAATSNFTDSLSGIREDLSRFDKTLETLARDKVDLPQFQEQLYRKADIRLLNDKADVERVLRVEKNVQALLKEMESLKKQHEEELLSVKGQLDSSMEAFLAAQATAAQQELDDSAVLTKGTCIGCGRPATSHRAADSRPYSPSQEMFMDGNNRGNLSPLKPLRVVSSFMAPVIGSSSQHHAHASNWNDPRAEPMDGLISPADGGGNLDDLPSNDRGGEEKVSLNLVRHAQGREDGMLLRPIRKKGFPGRKSLRAQTAYAPERFDLPRDFSRSLNLPAGGVLGSSIARPSLMLSLGSGTING